MTFQREVIERLDGWVNALAMPFMPPRVVEELGGFIRPEFRHHVPQAVMVGKLVRAVSGLRAALLLADSGYVTECAALLRIVSDFCTDVTAVGEALHGGGEPPRPVREFVAQYFTPKPRNQEEFERAERVRYVSREELMKAEVRLAEQTTVDGERLRSVHRYLNLLFDSYVHGAYETTMELCNPRSGAFAMRGHPSPEKRQEFADAVFRKAHEVVTTVELTAAVMANSDVFEAARETRRAMDASEPWRLNGEASA